MAAASGRSHRRCLDGRKTLCILGMESYAAGSPVAVEIPTADQSEACKLSLLLASNLALQSI